MWRIFVVLTVIVSGLMVYSVYSTEFAHDQYGTRYPIDEDSCWDSPKHCIKVTSKWTKDGKRFITTYENKCDSSVYLTACHEMEGPGWSSNSTCGAFNIRGGGKYYYSSFKSDRPGKEYSPTGNHAFSVVGVIKGSKSWLCHDKLDRPHPEDSFGE